MTKTLIGKNNFLFLQNDSARELEVHNNNLCLVHHEFYKRYETIKEKFLIIIFPNKSYIYSNFLPDNFNMIFRPGFDMYNNYFNNNILDGYQILKDVDDTYYKTDTHINNKGALIVFNEFVNKINNLFNLNINNIQYTSNKIEIENLNHLGLGIGDLLWDGNLGNQILESINDNYYEIIGSEILYTRYKFNINSEIKTLQNIDNSLIDKTTDNYDKILDWIVISNYILFKQNIHIDNKYKVVIFYDSFLCLTLQLYMNLFYEVYFIKNLFDINIVNVINPDYVFEFRVERFLL